MENKADQEKVMKNDEYVLDKLQQEKLLNIYQANHAITGVGLQARTVSKLHFFPFPSKLVQKMSVCISLH